MPQAKGFIRRSMGEAASASNAMKEAKIGKSRNYSTTCQMRDQMQAFAEATTGETPTIGKRAFLGERL